MKRVCTSLTLFAVLLAGCSSTDVVKHVDAGNGTTEPAAANEPDREDLTRDLEIARAKLELAELELAAAQQRGRTSLEHAKAETSQAEAKLALFRDATMPRRIASETLDLKATKDRAQEALDELAQIEIMYKEQDLDDLTAEFVVSRGRRQAERAQARIEIEEAAFKALTEMELPQEVQQHELAVAKARAGVEQAELELRISAQSKELAVQEARHKVEQLAAQLADLAEGAR